MNQGDSRGALVDEEHRGAIGAANDQRQIFRGRREGVNHRHALARGFEDDSHAGTMGLFRRSKTTGREADRGQGTILEVVGLGIFA